MRHMLLAGRAFAKLSDSELNLCWRLAEMWYSQHASNPFWQPNANSTIQDVHKVPKAQILHPIVDGAALELELHQVFHGMGYLGNAHRYL